MSDSLPSRRRSGSGAWSAAVAGALWIIGLAAASTAGAEPLRSPSTVLVWGSASPRLRAAVHATASAELRAAGWSLAALTEDAELQLGSCFLAEVPWPCLAPLLDEHRLASALALHVEREHAQVRVTGQLAAVSGQRVTLDFRYCAPCSEPDAEHTTRALVHRLVTEGAVRGAATKIVVLTEPPGATVRLDGRMIDAPGNELAASPGEHTLFLQLAGHRSELRTVRVDEGQTAVVRVRFVRDAGLPAAARAQARGATTPPPIAPPVRSGRALRKGTAVGLLAGGAAAIVAGLVLWQLDEDPLADPRVPHRPTYYDSARPGAAIGLAGVASMALGIALWPRAATPPASPCGASCSHAPRGTSAWWFHWSTTY